MKFTIYKAYVSYGGSMTGLPSFDAVQHDVSADYVQGYFKNLPKVEKTHQGFSTAPDSMGCYTLYKVEVSSL